MRQESIDNAKSMLGDLESGASRGVGAQINDGVVAAGDSIVEGVEGLAGGAYNVVTGNATWDGVSKAAGGAWDTVTTPSGWFQGTRDAWNTGQVGSAAGGIAPDVAGAAGLAKGIGKKLLGTAAKDAGETMAEAAARRTAAAKNAGAAVTDADLLVVNKNGVRISKVYLVHLITRKSPGLMTRKLSVTESRNPAQFRGTFSRRNPSASSANWAQVA